jgi:chemotaxis signal transduction protein
VLIVRRGAEAFGLVVDAVRQVVRLREEDIEATPAVLGGGDSEFIAGIGRPRPDRIVILLALDAVLAFTARGRA